MASYTEDKKSPGIFSTLHSEQTEKQDTVFESRRLAEHAYVRIPSSEDHLKGSMAIRMAFSCTCQPNIKDPRAQTTRQRKNPLAPLGLCHILKRAGCKEQSGKNGIHFRIWQIYKTTSFL